ncbi:hypothetical protein BpHYR1_022966, partial [Brachionus plicatilis]
MDKFVGTKALFKTRLVVQRGNLQKYNEDFKFETIRTFVEEYFTSVDVSKLTDHEHKIIENLQKHEIFVDCDVLDELKQHMCGGSDTVEKKTNFNTTFINNIEPLTGNEDGVDEWFNQYDRIAFANGWSREEKGRKLPVWLKDKALNTWYDMPQEKTIDDYSATLKKAFNKAFKSSASEDANKALLGRFRTGIIPKIQSIMCTTEPKNFEEAVELAGKIEKLLELRLSTMTINKIDKDRYNDNKTNAENPRKSRGANMEEFSNRRNRSKSNYSNRNTGSPWGLPVLYHSSTNSHNDITATYVKVTINGTKILAILDSGAAKTMISSVFAIQLNLKPLQQATKNKWVSASGSELISKGDANAKISLWKLLFYSKVR